jgi:hypothetical protein
MEVQGRIEKVLPIQSGTSANGAWRRQDFIVNYFEQPSDIYYRRIVLGVMNDRIDELKLKAGDEIKARYEIRVNEWNGRVFNDVRTGHIEVLKRSADDVATQSQQTGQQEQQTEKQAAAQAPQPAAEEKKEDDLPF